MFIGVCGAIGNISCIFRFAGAIRIFFYKTQRINIQVKQNARNFHRLMIFTAVFELLYILMAISLFSAPQLIPRYPCLTNEKLNM